MLKHTIAIALILFTSASLALSAGAETAQQNKMKDCNAQADSKGLKGSGKGPDRQAFMKECLANKPQAAAAGNSQQEKMKVCNKEASAKGLKGDERKTFMSGCLKN